MDTEKPETKAQHYAAIDEVIRLGYPDYGRNSRPTGKIESVLSEDEKCRMATTRLAVIHDAMLKINMAEAERERVDIAGASVYAAAEYLACLMVSLSTEDFGQARFAVVKWITDEGIDAMGDIVKEKIATWAKGARAK